MRRATRLLAPALLAAVAGCANVDIRRIGWPPHEPRPPEHPVALFVADFAPEEIQASVGGYARREADLPADAHRIAELEVTDGPFLSLERLLWALDEAARAAGGDAVLLEGIQLRLLVGHRWRGAAYRYEDTR